MASQSTQKKAKYGPVPMKYVCKSCGAVGSHWIMNCEASNNDKEVPIPIWLKDEQFNDKSSTWHNVRSNEYQLIYNAIKSSDYCNNEKYRQQNSLGIIPDGIISQISLYRISCCDVLNCNCCKSEINSYQFERKQTSGKDVLDYYLSDDYEENDKIFCKSCLNNPYLIQKCEIENCQKLEWRPDIKQRLDQNNDNNTNIRPNISSMTISIPKRCTSCDRFVCDRHKKEDLKCDNCESSICSDCKNKNECLKCNYCGDGLCYQCKASCGGCDGTDSAHDCSYHSKCIQYLNYCDLCENHYCEYWTYDSKACDNCEEFIDVNCSWERANQRLLCNACKKKFKIP